MNQIVIPHRITRSFIQSHPEWNFLFSCDVAKKSFFGQSYNAFGEPNAFPIPVMWKACKSSGFFQPTQHEEIIAALKEAFSAIPNDKPVVPFPRIGCGHSRFKEFCPKEFEYMNSMIYLIAYPNIKITYD